MGEQFIEELEGAYGIWLIERTKREAVAATQAIGILGGAVLTIEDLLDDPHYQERDVWETVDHPITGSMRYPGRHFVTSGATRQQMTRAPLLGEHTVEILSNIGYSNSDLVQLRRAKVI
jgi:crotonobetainyl-CoA:carnitine CoA-transferase CaiB-like acyl-CoA transferase